MTTKPSTALEKPPTALVAELGGTPATGIDLDQAAAVAAREDHGTVVHLRDEKGDATYYQDNGARKPVVIRIAGTYSGVYRRTLDVQRNRMLKQRRVTLDADQVTRQNIELVAACVLGWEGFNVGGTPLPYSRENAVRLLSALPWIREQLEEAQADHASFFSPASTS